MENKSEGQEYPEEAISQISASDVLLSEYEQSGEEFRNYEKLLNQSYYLCAIVFTFFIGAGANLLIEKSFQLIAILAFIATVVFSILGLAGKQYHKRRRSASILRAQIEEELNELTNSVSPRVQDRIVGYGDIRLDSERDLSPETLWEKYPIWKITLLTSGLWAIMSLISLYFASGI